jgi:hypothetical protein
MHGDIREDARILQNARAKFSKTRFFEEKLPVRVIPDKWDERLMAAPGLVGRLTADRR